MKEARGRIAVALLTSFVLGAPVAAASSYELKVLIDVDALARTGCTVPLPSGAIFDGVEAILTTTVTADDVTGIGKVTRVAGARCSNPALDTFDPPRQLGARQWSAAGPNLVVETPLSSSQLRQVLGASVSLSTMRLAYVAVPSAGPGGDAIVANGTSSILLRSDADGTKRRSAGPIRNILFDGKTSDWNGLDPVPGDEAAYRGEIRLVRAFAIRLGDMFYFRLDAGIGGASFEALPDALPKEGPIPLTVTFLTKASSTGGQLLRYRWDFEGDGIFDTNDPGARNHTRTFFTPGVYDAVLEVTNDKQQTTTGTVRIRVTGAPPVAVATVTPSNGAVPLKVTFTGSAIRGTAPIARYEWDLNGDGTFEFSSATTGNTTHTYTAARTYTARFRVVDTAGLSAIAPEGATTVRGARAGSPTATITSPTGALTRNTGDNVSFNGTGTTPSGTITKYEWDFNGDGTYDYAAPTAAASYTYESPGTFTVSLRITNSAGLRSVDTVDVAVSMQVTLKLSPDTLRPPGTVSINTNVKGKAPVSLFIRNKSGDTIRTLVASQTRAAGNYSDKWDGTTDAGVLVPEGEYYAVLKYIANGVPVLYDLTTTTGNDSYNPSWNLATTKDGSCFTCIFDPYEDDFLQGTFTLSRASAVTVSIRGYDTVYEAAPLFDHRLFGSGVKYTVYWDGANATGQLVHPSQSNDSQFIFGMTAVTLPDNAIFVERAPELTDVTVTPNYFDPFTGDFLSPQKTPARVAYKLSKPATVRLQVHRAGTNAVLRTIEKNAPAGAGEIVWDGRNDQGMLADAGDYRIALKATDSAGHQSLVRYALMKVFY
ncbi:MAG TPA: PKD domain-containing protein [Thermoanaerobaculia bacterium]|nr:PKD domain-containing protein [Thermoanaerobaculia bacterium]